MPGNMNGEKTSTLYGVEDAPPHGVTAALGLQHVFVLLGGIELVPVMLSRIHSVSVGEIHRVMVATTIMAAVATLFQLYRYKRFGLGYTMFIGTSGAFMSCAHSAIDMGGFALLAFMGVICTPFQALYCYFFRFLKNIITPVVGGVVIMLAMTGMLKDAVIVWTGGGGFGTDPGQAPGGCRDHHGPHRGRVVRGEALASLEHRHRRGRGLSGGLALWHAGFFRGPGRAAFSVCRISCRPGSNWNSRPSTSCSSGPLRWPPWSPGVKYTGDAMALQQVSSTTRKKVDYDALQGGLYASVAGSVLSGLAGGMPITSHSPNISLIQVTGAASRRIGVVGVALMVIFSACPRILLLMASLPSPVVGAVAVTLVAHLFSTGMMLAVSDGLSFKKGLIVGFPLCAGIVVESDLFFAQSFPAFLHPLITNGFAVGGLVAVVLSAMSRFMPGKREALRVDLSDGSLAVLFDWLAAKSARFGLDRRRGGYRLQLACEEVFMHMRSEFERHGFTGPVTFKLFNDESRLVVEVVGGTTMAEVDAVTEPPRPERADGQDLDRLGLYLLGKVAREVSHVHISGYAYVTFSIPLR